MDELKTDKGEKSSRSLSRLQIAVIAFLLGIVSFIAYRVMTIQDTSVHYHANFALYVNGQRDEFKSFTFYEEVQACGSDDANNVKAKTHMHDQNSSLVHVHAAGMTWGQFFANLGYGLSNKALTTDDGVFVDDQGGNELTFMLNGQPTANIANQVIGDKDVLLINYGQDDKETLTTRYDTIPRDAAEANTKNDPSSCSGGHQLTFVERLKQVVGVGQKSSHDH